MKQVEDLLKQLKNQYISILEDSIKNGQPINIESINKIIEAINILQKENTKIFSSIETNSKNIENLNNKMESLDKKFDDCKILINTEISKKVVIENISNNLDYIILNKQWKITDTNNNLTFYKKDSQDNWKMKYMIQ